MASLGCGLFSTKKFKKLPTRKTRSCQLVVVGDKQSGKTSLIFRFSRDRMPSAGEAMRSVLDTDELDVQRNGKMIQLTVHDTSGDDDYAKVRALTYNKVDGILLCLPLDSLESARRLELEWEPELRHLCSGKPFLLVGTKRDLRDNARLDTFITKKQGKRFAKTIGAFDYVECSALDKKNGSREVKRVFGRALRECLQRK